MPKKRYFFYKNSWNYRSFWVALAALLILWVYFTLGKFDAIDMPHKEFAEDYYVLITAILTSYIVSFMFHLGTTVKDKKEKDIEAALSLSAIAHCYNSYKNFIHKNFEIPCSHGDMFNIIEDCVSDCHYKSIKCMLWVELKILIDSLDASLRHDMIIICSVKPELMVHFGECYNSVFRIKSCLEHASLLNLEAFDSIEKVHNFFMMNDNGFIKNDYADASELKTVYIKALELDKKNLGRHKIFQS